MNGFEIEHSQNICAVTTFQDTLHIYQVIN